VLLAAASVVFGSVGAGLYAAQKWVDLRSVQQVDEGCWPPPLTTAADASDDSSPDCPRFTAWESPYHVTWRWHAAWPTLPRWQDGRGCRAGLR
jgi:hypothetical protein